MNLTKTYIRSMEQEKQKANRLEPNFNENNAEVLERIKIKLPDSRHIEIQKR